METSAQKLRQKAINLLYLIVLALLFNFIESDFIDTTKETNDTLNRIGNHLAVVNKRYQLMVLEAIENDQPKMFDKANYQLNAIDTLTDEIIGKLDALKLMMVQQSGYSKHGYLKHGKEESISKQVLLTEGKALQIIKDLEEYKKRMGQFINAEKRFDLDSILPLPSLVMKSNGNMTAIEEYYFYKTPLAVSIMSISSFKSRVQELHAYVGDQVIKGFNYNTGTPFPQDISEIVDLRDEQIVNKGFVQEFIEDIIRDNERFDIQEEEEEKLTIAELLVESKSDSVYAVGKPAEFNITFDTAASRSVSVMVEGPQNYVQSYTLRKPGTFMFVPEIKGTYSIRINNGTRTSGKQITVIDIEPVLQNDAIGTLYIGVDNILNIKTSQFETTQQLTARISDGQVLKKGKNFYARVKNEGIVKVEVFAQMDYGYVKVAEKKFLVRSLNKPIPHMLDRENGSAIAVSDVKDIKTLQVKSNEVLVNEQYYISEFEFTIIYNNHTAILKPIENTGSSLNASSIEALERVKSGDIIIFNHIKAKSSLGTEIELPQLTYTIY